MRWFTAEGQLVPTAAEGEAAARAEAEARAEALARRIAALEDEPRRR